MATTEVLLCTYNGRPFIGTQLQSILDQTRPVDRISIHDDGSSDGTLADIEALLRRQPPEVRARVQVHVNPVNLGFAANFAQAIARATGDLLFLCDQDDLWEPDKVSVLAGLLESGRCDMACSDGILIDADGRRLGDATVLASHGLTRANIDAFPDQALTQLLRRNCVNGAACAVRRSAAQAAMPPPGEMPHDHWLAVWCALHGGISMTNRALYHYRQHGHNTIGIGASRWLYRGLGIWRHARHSRLRDLRIWSAAAARLQGLAGVAGVNEVQRKVAWLARVAEVDASRAVRLSRILRSALDGSYRRYAAREALLRDLVSTLRRSPRA